MLQSLITFITIWYFDRYLIEYNGGTSYIAYVKETVPKEVRVYQFPKNYNNMWEYGEDILKRFPNRFRRVLGVDLSEGMLAVGRQKLRALNQVYYFL